MKTTIVNRSRVAVAPNDPHRKGLRAPAVHLGGRFRNGDVGLSRGVDRAAQAMSVLNKTTEH